MEYIDKKTGEIFAKTPTGRRSKARSKISNLTLDQLQQKEAANSERFWAKMRTNINLMFRSDFVAETKIDKLKSELGDILESSILNYPQTLSQLNLSPEMGLKEKKLWLGLNPISPVKGDDEKRFLKCMAYKAAQVNKSNWAWRIGQEAVEKQEEKWFPFFVTLTVDPKLTDPEELWREGREFRKYIRRLANVVCKEVGDEPCHKPPYRPESDYVTYCGVIEHGKSREHHHGHFIIWLRRIPPNWGVCPNAGIRNPANRTKRDCLPMQSLWKWSGYDTKTGRSLSPAMYFRSLNDVWQNEKNHVLPIVEGRPMSVMPTRIAGHYLTKYLEKEHREWKHRMKATRNIGMRKLKMLMQNMSSHVIEALTWRPKTSQLNTTLMRTHFVPLGLIRSEAKRQNYLNLFRQNLLELKTLLQSNCNIYTKMLLSVKDGARPDRMDSSEFFDWVSAHYPVQKGYSNERLIAAHCAVATVFPREKRVPKHVKQGGNDIGYS